MKQLLPDYLEAGAGPITIAFTPEAAYYSERLTGNLWEYKDEKFRLVHHFEVAPVTGHHETGLFGIALSPNFVDDGYIYCFYTSGEDEASAQNRLVRVHKESGNEEIIFDNLPAGRIHNGGIVSFGPDKCLYVGIGVPNEIMNESQDIKSLRGKILRINSDGSIPHDNPFPGSPVYSYGHRNIFGLAFHPTTHKLYISDVGPDKDDEINIINPGGNYGWPKVTGIGHEPSYLDPIITYTPPMTPTQSVFVNGQLYFGSYNEGSVHRLSLGGENFEKVIKDEIVYRGRPFGVVGVFYGPDKNFYVTTTTEIILFEPQSQD